MIGVALGVFGAAAFVVSIAQEAEETAEATVDALDDHITSRQMVDLMLDEHLYETASESKFQSCVIAGEGTDVCADQKAERDSVHAAKREAVIEAMKKEAAENE